MDSSSVIFHYMIFNKETTSSQFLKHATLLYSKDNNQIFMALRANVKLTVSY